MLHQLKNTGVNSRVSACAPLEISEGDCREILFIFGKQRRQAKLKFFSIQIIKQIQFLEMPISFH